MMICDTAEHFRREQPNGDDYQLEPSRTHARNPTLQGLVYRDGFSEKLWGVPAQAPPPHHWFPDMVSCERLRRDETGAQPSRDALEPPVR